MCLAALYYHDNEGDKLIDDKIAFLKQGAGNSFSCVNLFGERTDIMGELDFIDLQNSRICIRSLEMSK